MSDREEPININNESSIDPNNNTNSSKVNDKIEKQEVSD